MEIISRVLPPNGTIVDSGDYHLGAVNCNKQALLKMIQRVKDDPTCFMLNKGDSIEAILPNDKRFTLCASDTELRTPANQRDWLIDHFRPIKDKILAWGFGNHEYKLVNTLNIGKEVSDALGVPFGFYCYVLVLCDEMNKPRFKVFVTHGSGQLTSNAKDPIQREGNRQAALKMKLERAGFRDCVVMTQGHTHQSIVTKPTINREVILTASPKGRIHHSYRTHTDQSACYIPPEARWFLNSPSFLTTYSPPGSMGISYAEVAGYAPAEIGWMEIDYSDYRVTGVRKVHV
jgi:hypothetical protein